METGAALNILASLRYSSVPGHGDDSLYDIDTVHVYLRTFLVLHSIGQTVQSFQISVLDDPSTSPEKVPSVASPSSPELLLRLLTLMRRCLSLSQKDMTRMRPAPWSTESSFMSLKDELDTLYIFHADERVLDTETLDDLQAQEGSAGSYVMCLSMFHASRCQNSCCFFPDSFPARL